MAAYSAVVCFEQLLKQLVSTDHFPKEEIDSLQAKLSSLKLSIEKIFPAKKNDRATANKMGDRIRDAAYKAQDSIESFIFSKSYPSESDKTPGGSQSSLQEIEAKMDLIIQEAEALAGSIGKDKKDSESLTYKASESGTRTRIVGQDKEVVTAQLLSDVAKREVIPITGMPGSGKTVLARSVFEDAKIRDKFPYRAWVTVSQDYNVADILAKLLSSVESRGQKGGEKVFEGSESTLREKLHQTLYNNKYLVVIDDMWDDNVWNKLQLSLPDNENRSRVLLTTRIRDVAKFVKSSGFFHEMQPLDEFDSWTLLRHMTFGDAPCPSQTLENIGREIAKNCRGLPLSLTVIGHLLAQERKEEDYWRSIAEDINAATMDTNVESAYKEILYLSYEHLPPKLKACFLYMAAFPQDTEIPVSKLVKLWVAEGFLTTPSPPQTIEKVAEQSLVQLIDRNLILIRKNGSDGRIKTCSMHDSFWELAEEEAEKEKFLYSIKKQVEKLEEGAESQRRVSVHETVVMCRRQVFQSTKSIKLARSLLYVDPSYSHPLPFYLTFNLLRLFDALAVFFVEFPHEITKLIHLRYLSLTYNGKLPPSLSNLKNLQVLMVRRQVKIIFVGESFLPDEIWNMSQLRHLLFTESDLPPPLGAENSVLFANLQSISNVSASSCTEKVLQNMPNLKRLGMWTKAPGEVEFYVGGLSQLEAFKFKVLKPNHGSRIYFQPQLSFPKTLRKLSLSGCGLPWEDMEVIGKLPNLEVLKLRDLAFHGDEWCPTYVFHKLKYLLIEYLNLKCWETDGSHCPLLERLTFRHCYELEGIPTEIGLLERLELIELVECSPAAVDAMEYIREQAEDYGNEHLQVRIKSSWE